VKKLCLSPHLKKRLSPHVAIGDKVGQHCSPYKYKRLLIDLNYLNYQAKFYQNLIIKFDLISDQGSGDDSAMNGIDFTCNGSSNVIDFPGVNFINVKRTNFSYEMSFRQLFSSDM